SDLRDRCVVQFNFSPFRALRCKLVQLRFCPLCDTFCSSPYLDSLQILGINTQWIEGSMSGCCSALVLLISSLLLCACHGNPLTSTGGSDGPRLKVDAVRMHRSCAMARARHMKWNFAATVASDSKVRTLSR